MPLDSKEDVERVLETKEVKAQDKGEVATIAVNKVTSLVNIQSPKKTRILLEELGVIVKMAMNFKMTQLIMDSGCTKHMNEHRRLFTSYKAYDGGHVVSGSNLKGKVNDRVRFTKVDYTIIKNGKMLAIGHRKNGLYTCKFRDNSKQQICLASMMDNTTLWQRRLVHANMRLVQKLASNDLVRNLSKLSFERHFCHKFGLGSQGPFTSLSSEIVEITHLEDHRINVYVVQDINGSPSLQVNVLDEGYPKSVKEARCHPIEQVISEFNERTLLSKTKQA
nr:hypothetical protein [Tanacetum cinerariifolium]